MFTKSFLFNAQLNTIAHGLFARIVKKKIVRICLFNLKMETRYKEKMEMEVTEKSYRQKP